MPLTDFLKAQVDIIAQAVARLRPNRFTTYGGPANLLETANTIGMPLYAPQHLDEKGRWIDVMIETSILPGNNRPRLAVRIQSSN